MINCCWGSEAAATAGVTEEREERKVVLVLCAAAARPEMLTELEMLLVRGWACARGELSLATPGESGAPECTMY